MLLHLIILRHGKMIKDWNWRRKKFVLKLFLNEIYYNHDFCYIIIELRIILFIG